MDIENTEWAIAFKADSPVSYEQALRLARDPDLEVEIVYTTETEPGMWVIDAGELAPGFWLDMFQTKEECEELCKVMGWRTL